MQNTRKQYSISTSKAILKTIALIHIMLVCMKFHENIFPCVYTQKANLCIQICISIVIVGPGFCVFCIGYNTTYYSVICTNTSPGGIDCSLSRLPLPPRSTTYSRRCGNHPPPLPVADACNHVQPPTGRGHRGRATLRARDPPPAAASPAGCTPHRPHHLLLLLYSLASLLL